MNRLNGLRFLAKNICENHGFDLFKNNLLNSSGKTIKSIEKWYHTDDINSSHEWIKDLNEPQKEKILLIRNELVLFSNQDQRVPKPEWLSQFDYMEMLGMTTSKRRSYYKYLFSRYNAKFNSNTKKNIRDAIKLETDEDGKVEILPQKGHIKYGIGANTLIRRVSKQQMSRWKNRNLVRAFFQNQPPLVFDCEFVHEMNNIEVESAIREIKLSFCALRESKTPYVMHLCNLQEDTYFWNRLKKGFYGFQKAPIIISPKDVTELFKWGTEKLIYLSPDAEQVLDKVDPSYGFVIGAIVDKGDKKPFTSTKARKLNIESARLPIEGFVKFATHKALAFDQITKILLEAKYSNDWERAFKHIPRRKLK